VPAVGAPAGPGQPPKKLLRRVRVQSAANDIAGVGLWILKAGTHQHGTARAANTRKTLRDRTVIGRATGDNVQSIFRPVNCDRDSRPFRDCPVAEVPVKAEGPYAGRVSPSREGDSLPDLRLSRDLGCNSWGGLGDLPRRFIRSVPDPHLHGAVDFGCRAAIDK
jgi:hypothetical protein